MDYKVVIESNMGEVREVLRVNQACFGEMARGFLDLEEGGDEHIKSVRYYLMNSESLEDVKSLAKILKVEAVYGEEEYSKPAPYPKKGELEVRRKYIEVKIADMTQNDGMYKLFLLRNLDKYFYGNSHPVSYKLYKEGRIKLIEAVALMNTFKEYRSSELGAGPKVAGFTNLITYNSLLVDSVTTVADFRRFLRDPNDTHPKTVKPTFRECGTGYSRQESYICTNFVKNVRPHNTKLIRHLWAEVAGETVVPDKGQSVTHAMRDKKVMAKVINKLLQRKVVKNDEEFFFDTDKQTSRT